MTHSIPQVLSPLGFRAGVEGWFFSALVAVELLVYASLCWRVVARAFQTRHVNRWNGAALLVLLAVMIGSFLVPTSASGFIFVHPLLWYFQFWFGFWLLWFFIVTRTMAPAPEVTRPGAQLAAFTVKAELRRKGIHFFILCLLLAYLIGHLVFHYVWHYAYPALLVVSTPENAENVRLLATMDPYRAGNVILMFALVSVWVVQGLIEIIRLNWPHLAYPFQKTLHKNQRRTETGMFSAHVYMMPAIYAAGLLLFWNLDTLDAGAHAMIALIAVSVFGDTAAALVGRQFGRHKWRWFPSKSYEGSVAGVVVSFCSAVLFVGPGVALAAAGVFLFTDIGLAKLELSDNWTTPLVLGVVFRLLIGAVTPLVAFPVLAPW